MSPHKIALIGGDGIGPEVVREGRLLLELCREERGLPLELWELDLGADRFLRDGTTFPAEIRVAIQRECAAVLLGALGDPRVPNLEHARDIIFGMRQGFDLYANVRPCRALSDRLVPLKGRGARDVDFVVFRENTEGIYVGMGGQFKRGTPDEVAINEDVNTRKGVERIIRAAFEHARRHGKPVVHMADKSNAMRHAHELWLRVFDQVAREYAPAVRGKHVYVDALCLYLIQDPSQFQVIVTNNLFGDIITDLGAALQGGLGMAASANVHGSELGRVAMFEPVHGSAPDIAGKGIANPFACLLTVGMLLAHLGHAEEERVIEAAVARAIDDGQCTRDVGGKLNTQEAAAWVRDEIRRVFRSLRLAQRQERVGPLMASLPRSLPMLAAAGLLLQASAAHAQPAPTAAPAPTPAPAPTSTDTQQPPVPPGPIIKSPPSPAEPDGPPERRTLAIEGAVGGSLRAGSASTGFPIDERFSPNLHIGPYLGIGSHFDLGLHYLHTGLGVERTTAVATSAGVSSQRYLDAVMLDARVFPVRAGLARFFLGITAGLGWQSVDHSATTVEGTNFSPVLHSTRCSARGSAGFGLGGSLGADFDLGSNVMFLVRTAATVYRLSSDVLRDGGADCASGAGSSTMLMAQIGFQYRFDLSGSKQTAALPAALSW